MNKLMRVFPFALLLCCACGGGGEEQEATQVLRPVKYVTVGSTNIIGEHSYTGLAKAQRMAHLSFKVSGTVDDIYVKVGDLVRRDQVLTKLDDTDYQVNYDLSLASIHSSNAQIENARAQLESAKANLINAESNYQRFEKLYETNSISLSDFEQAKSAYLSADASYKASLTQIEAAKTSSESSENQSLNALNQVAYTKMTAPFNGVITAINLEPNEVVNQGSQIIEINSIVNPDIEVGVPEGAIASIQSNQEVTVVFNSLVGATFHGRVHEIGYSSAGSTYPVTIRLTDDDERIRPGMPATATFQYDDKRHSEKAKIVPPSAVGKDVQGNYVYVLNKENDSYVCSKRPISVGLLNDYGFEVLEGVKEGELVASAGLNVLQDGMSVTLYNDK